MKKLSRFTAWLLVLTLAFSCVGAGAFAASESTVKQYGKVDEAGYGGYFAIGDSVTRGCTLEHYYDYEHRIVPGSYPAIIAAAVGCDNGSLIDDITNQSSNYWPFCWPGLTTHCTLKHLGVADGWDYDIFADEHYTGNARYMEMYFPKAQFDAHLANSSLITVEQGICDVIYRAQIVTNRELGMEDGTFATTPEFIEKYLYHLYEGYEYWVNAYPLLLQYIKDVTKAAGHDPTIVLVGAYNVFEGLTISDEILIPIGNVVSALTCSMNMYYQKWAKEYGCLYADISNVETPMIVNENTVAEIMGGLDMNAAIHPTVEGNAYIARQILSVLPEEPIGEPVEEPVKPVVPPSPTAKTDIVVDLGHYSKGDVVSVKVNGSSTKKWEFRDPDNEHELTVYYLNKRATSLIVTLKEDGKYATAVFKLSYKNGAYVPTRIYSTGDTVNVVTTAVRSVVTVGSKLLDAFAGLFKK